MLWSLSPSFGLDVGVSGSQVQGWEDSGFLNWGAGYEGISQFGTWGKGCSCPVF